ncbi:MAG TPA: hypothetical protein VF498_11625 [Anaerolineales bacterium]
MDRASAYTEKSPRKFAAHGWVGLSLIGVFWALNWTLPGPRTQWAFFPLWLGYCLTVDALVLVRRGTSLLTRDWRKYISLFLISAPVWWIFEVINWRLQNWSYIGVELLTQYQFWFYATVNFTVVIPAVFGSAELAGSFAWVHRLGRWLVVRPDRVTTSIFFVTGLVMFALMWAWPQYFFPFVWISVYFILEPINIWLGYRSLGDWLKKGDWRPVVSLWVGVLITAFFWEMWNFFSYPKWVYHVPWGNGFHVFEMPLLGYGGYLPFALELFAIYHFVTGIFGSRNNGYVEIGEE